MSGRSFALMLLLSLTSWAQEFLRKPSPFPEKNRERESAAAAPERPPLFRSHMAGRMLPVAGDWGAIVPAAPGTGKACFFLAKAGSVPAAGAVIGPDDLVAAHATYGLGSRVSVTNLANGKTVEVRILGRFFDSRRVISVSEAAARQLGFREAGTADVKVELVTQ